MEYVDNRCHNKAGCCYIYGRELPQGIGKRDYAMLSI